MKRILLKSVIVCCLLLLGVSCKNNKKEITEVPKDGFSINGIFKNGETGKVLLVRFDEGEEGTEITDTIPIINGTFSHTGKVPYPKMVMFGLDTEDKAHYHFVFLDNTSISVEIDTTKASEFEALKITGAPTNDEYRAFDKLTKSDILKEASALYPLLESTTDKEKQREIEAQIEAIYTKKDEAVDAYIKAHPDSYVSAHALSWNAFKEPDHVQGLYDVLSDRIKNTDIGKKIKAQIEQLKKTALGAVAQEVSMSNPEGEILKLSDLRGKYVLLEFWASWCGPCRTEAPHLKKVYSKYKDKGFEILAVSLDDNKDAWVKAIEEDGVPWLHVSDLSGRNNKAAKEYRVDGIPMNFLLDKEGKIIAKALRGHSLEDKLAELL